MPMYEYSCSKCGGTVDEYFSMYDSIPELQFIECPCSNDLPVEHGRVWSPTAIMRVSDAGGSPGRF